MFALTVAAASALIAGFLLGAICAWPKLRGMRTELAATRWLAEHDPLTGLPNRACAQRHHELQVAAGNAHAAVLIDLDGFKAVNDTWGHQAGDAQLTAVAERLAAACTSIGALASRLAGDEFLLLLPHSDPHAVLEHVNTILARVSKPITLPVQDAITITATPTASAGIALPESGNTWADLLRRADIALYRAKATPGHAVLYTRGMQQPILRAHCGPRLRESEAPHSSSRAAPAQALPLPAA
jgi:diguanylate cyclase (GGDEF)-like protein